MDMDLPARDVGPGNASGDDYEYDEAHAVQTTAERADSPPRPTNPPGVDIGTGGDYGYDEAHDLGAR